MAGTRSQTEPPPASGEPFNLFVYGTLMAPTVFRAVLGYRLVTRAADQTDDDTFLARDAVLPGYKKISPDNTYLYAVADPQGRINGYVIGPLPAHCLEALHAYEGRNYRGVKVKVQTAQGRVDALAFIGNTSELSHAFGWRFHDRLKQEVLLREQIEQALQADETARLHTDEALTRRALSELHGLTIRDLIRRHFDAGGISPFAIQQALRDEPLREFPPSLQEPSARAVAPNYLTLLVRQVLFNQIEDRIREEFRFALDRMQVAEKFYERTISALAALRLLNEQKGLLNLLAGDALIDLPLADKRLIDCVRWAVQAADAVYSPAAAGREIEYIQNHLAGGDIPLGVELEFSNIGHRVILDPSARTFCDEQYDGFLYFRDFALDILTWKLGGHVDDHRVKSAPGRRRGFFELAFGSLSVEANISKPITDEPWVLNQLIHAALDFYNIRPHSLHVSLQLRKSDHPTQGQPLPLAVIKCLLAIAGDAGADADGVVRIRRFSNEEIARARPAPNLLFSAVSRRQSSEEAAPGADRGKWVQQYKFMRLDPKLNYETIVMALKGLQLRYNTGSFMTVAQYRASEPARRLYEELSAWAKAPTPLSPREINEFVTGMRDGLMDERRGRPAHTDAYIQYCIFNLRNALAAFNALLRNQEKARQAPPANTPDTDDRR